jgi:phosphoribosylaminoimidazole-succinocarboxamide synthase
VIGVFNGGEQGAALSRQLAELGFPCTTDPEVRAETALDYPALAQGGERTLLERALRPIPFDFETLPLLCEGESKVLRLWTDRVVVQRFKPTVYSFTINRYGMAEGTDRIRIRFTSELFRRLSQEHWARSAFLAEVESDGEPFLVQRRIEPCNLEVRVKRYHIGSPVHRYRYTEQHPTAGGAPLLRWTRFEKPIVCFDWRHPLRDDAGNALADEPLSDDYASVWMEDVSSAKSVASSTFVWLESLFREAGVLLVDMCLFIDVTGTTIYGEISPDCMRVRLGLGPPEDGQPLDKDLWRAGRNASVLRDHYDLLTERIFGFSEKEVIHG